MQILDDSSAQMIQGGHHKGAKDNIKPVRQLLRLGVQQMNLAINIIIGSGSISNMQANLLGIGSFL
jgi:hypothetical protein